jgi:hypothetical protein
MKLKERIFDVLCGITPLSEFEQWLYQDVEVQCLILDDDNVLRLMMIDFSGRHAFHELRKYGSDIFDDEEFYVYTLEENAKKIVEAEDILKVICCVENICEYSDWCDEKNFFNTFYSLQDAYDDFEYSGYSTRIQIIEEMKSFAKDLLEKFEWADIIEKKVMVFESIEPIFLSPVHYSPSPAFSPRPKRWFEFWK